MRYRKAKSRLNGSVKGGSLEKESPELLDHLKERPHYLEDRLAEQTLQQMFQAAGEDDAADVTPLPAMRRKIETQISLDRHRSITDHAVCETRRQPLFSIGVVVVAAALILLTLIPFKYDRAIGYDIAFAGVNRELAEDNERICDMLYALGLIEAAVDILECDTTCRVVIIDLKSRAEVQLVVTALENINPSRLTAKVIPVHSKTTGTLLDQANERLFNERIQMRPDGAIQ